MSDETLIPLSPEEAPEATHEALPAETAEVVINDAPVTTEVVDDAPSVAEELDTTDAVQGDIADDAETSPIADTPAEEVAPPAKPQTIISAFGGNRSSGKSSSRRGGGHSSDSRPTGGEGGRRDDRRGGKSGFEPVNKEFEEVLLEVGRVTKVTSGGRQLRFRAAVVIGDRKGRVGFGLGKAREVSIAVEKAVNSAKRNLIKVPLENGTVPYQVETKFKSVKIMIHPATEGTGIIAGGSARRILELAGCQNILSKRHGGRNVITTAYATMEALKKYQVKTGSPTFSSKDKAQSTTND